MRIKHSMNIRCDGFTLVELIMVLVLVGLISTLALPRYVNHSSDSLAAAKKDTGRVVKSAMMVAMADTHEFPTVRKLASYVRADEVNAVGKGIEVIRKGSRFTVLTYRDSNCSQKTHGVSDTVKCVGSAP